eukprot:CAMPEP_0197878328 /NCGR_PEP_ID=MMETSP1439-20131203/6732_1 /TAXON_ID=66791 /ORGANISM="Gonyaulax spinifera, Strain CCMP409" /LENGTH=412 /DNA_ID=CAMNT_0043497731 /DNA_START=80 /DNA_END=1315 /DNA_ORIENTATION=+
MRAELFILLGSFGHAARPSTSHSTVHFSRAFDEARVEKSWGVNDCGVVFPSPPPTQSQGQATGSASEEDTLAAKTEWHNMLLKAAANRRALNLINSSKPPIVYNFAIGSIFNDESRRSSALKSQLTQLGPESSCSARFDALVNTEVKGYMMGTIERGVQRMWTYPSGPPWDIWAVSLHETGESMENNVLGGLVLSDIDTFVLMRPREKEYDVIQISGWDIRLEDGRYLGELHPDRITFAYAYGYKMVPNKITDMFSEEPRIRQAFTSPKVNAKAAATVCAHDAMCEAKVANAKGHFLAQSYIDVILSGLLQRGSRMKFGSFGHHDFYVWGGKEFNPDQDKLDAEEASIINFAREFLSTTVWPIKELKSGEVVYINDRMCPRNPNPLFTPSEFLHSHHKAGTSSAGRSIKATW